MWPGPENEAHTSQDDDYKRYGDSLKDRLIERKPASLVERELKKADSVNRRQLLNTKSATADRKRVPMAVTFTRYRSDVAGDNPKGKPLSIAQVTEDV